MDIEIAKIRLDGGTQPRAQICHVCGFNFSPVLHQHHIRPRCEGGCNDKDNLVHLCPNCHSLAHELYKWGTSKDSTEYEAKHANYIILTDWIRENLGELGLGRLQDIAQSRHYKRDKRYE